MINHSWYLIRSKQHKESLVHSILSNHAIEAFLPMMRNKAAYRGKESIQLVPLFPGYLFAYFDIHRNFHSIQRMHGVAGVVCAGNEPCEVPAFVIDEIKRRQRNGVIELPVAAYRSGQKVQIVGGPLKGISAVFQEYLSGAARVAIILRVIGGFDVRAVLPTSQIGSTDA